MLFLTRRPSERIFIIGPDQKEIQICIEVRSILGNHVSLGIEADKSYSILREEVFLRQYQGNLDEDGQE